MSHLLVLLRFFFIIQETKTNEAYVQSLLRSTNPTNVVGVNAISTRGELVVFFWDPFLVKVVANLSGKEWYPCVLV